MFQHDQSMRDSLDSEFGQLMYTFIVELMEDTECLVYPELVYRVPCFPCIEDENHAGVEGLLAHGPADEHGLVAVVEEHECL